MSPEKQRVAIATACGWTAEQDSNGYWRATNQKNGHASELWLSERNVWSQGIPDYLNDLNACHEMEKVLTVAQRVTYAHQMGLLLTGGSVGRAIPDWWFIHVATSAERCEAFLRVFGLWTEIPTQPQ